MSDVFLPHCLDRKELSTLFDALKSEGYLTVGPVKRDGALLYDEIECVDDLPIGWTDEQEAGSYRLKRRNDDALFGYNVGPHSWKTFLFPAKTKLWSASKPNKQNSGNFIFKEGNEVPPKYAFIGVRACELHAIQVQDKVFMGGTYQDPVYSGRRQDSFIVAVNCAQAASTCFCSSMETGPKVGSGFDLSLTEILNETDHYFVLEAGSERGVAILNTLPTRPAEQNDCDAAALRTENARKDMGRSIDISDISELLTRNYDNARWAELERKCLSCGNCTMACPTCFCSKVEDVTDLTGEHAERWRSWDSCFTLDFSHIHGGSVRSTIGSRYRHWLMHKLSTWMDQFGSSGCVGCGRCITWCPVGIDLTEEVRAIRDSEKGNTHDG